MEVGALCAVVPDAMQFCFELATEGTVTDNARLDMDSARLGALPLLRREFEMRTDLVVPLWERGCGGPGRAGAADYVDGSELTMCATCGCDDDGGAVTVPGRPRRASTPT